MTREAVPGLTVRAGVCRVMYAYDIGFSIDMERCRQAMPPEAFPPRRRPSRHFDLEPEPLLIRRSSAPITVGRFQTRPDVEMQVYDFGGVSVSFTIPIEGPLSALLDLTCELGEDPRLLGESRRLVEALLEEVRGAVTQPGLADAVEDYMLLHVAEFDSPISPADIPVHMARELAQVLRAERAELSAQETADAMAHCISYGREDVTVVDWNAALALGRDMDDVRAVLEFANLELLEMRCLDRKLDNYLDRAYALVSGPERRRIWPRRNPPELHRLAELRLDGAILFERVSNAPKLLGDQYLARLYRLAAQRFHLAEWNASILRKLEVIDGIYEKLAERASTRRLEVLEWIIILLIAFEIGWTLWSAG